MFSAQKYGGGMAGKGFPHPHYAIPDYKASDFAPSWVGNSRDLKKRCVGKCRRDDSDGKFDAEFDESAEDEQDQEAVEKQGQPKRCTGKCRRDEPDAEFDEDFEEQEEQQEDTAEKREMSPKSKRCTGKCRKDDPESEFNSETAEEDEEEEQESVDKREPKLPYGNLIKVPELKILLPTVAFSDNLGSCADAGQATPLVPGSCVPTASSPVNRKTCQKAIQIDLALDGKPMNCDSKWPKSNLSRYPGRLLSLDD
jgi:hypothetical protein